MFPNVNDLTKKIEENTSILNRLLDEMIELNRNIREQNDNERNRARAARVNTGPG